jgi:hypothetical protein
MEVGDMSDKRKMPKMESKPYVELDGVLYRGEEAHGSLWYTKKFVGGKWVGNPDMARAAMAGMGLDEDEAREEFPEAFED